MPVGTARSRLVRAYRLGYLRRWRTPDAHLDGRGWTPYVYAITDRGIARVEGRRAA